MKLIDTNDCVCNDSDCEGQLQIYATEETTLFVSCTECGEEDRIDADTIQNGYEKYVEDEVHTDSDY